MLRAGQCTYCGQTRMLEVEDGITKEELNQEATENCNCECAINARESAKAEAEAVENIETLFKDFPDTANILKAAIIPIMAGELNKVVIDTGRKVKAQVMRTSKDNIKVERSESKKMVLES